MSEGYRDESGLFAVVGHPRAVAWTVAGLRALRHRGDGSSGLVSSDGAGLRVLRGPGANAEALETATLRGHLGHVAFGQVFDQDVPDGPVVGRSRGHALGVAMSGRLIAPGALVKDIEQRGALRVSDWDGEIVAHRMALSPLITVVNRVVDALHAADGGWALFLATERLFVAARDPRGLRPLVLGRIDGATVFASEDVAIRAIGAEVVRDVAPGEMLIVEGGHLRAVFPFPRPAAATCAQEAVSLARDEGRACGQAAWGLRVRLGERLAAEHRDAVYDAVVPWPEGGLPYAMGVARVLDVPLAPALSGPMPGPDPHPTVVCAPSQLENRRVAVILPALTDGTLVAEAVRAMRRAGVAEAHVLVASPEAPHPCPYGPLRADRPSPTLRAGWADALGADSVAFLSMPTFRDALGAGPICVGCCTGEWPLVPPPDSQLALFARG